MPIYCFNAAKLADCCPDVRWTRLKDEEAARRFAKLLVEEFVASGRYADCSDWRLDVRDENGGLLLSIPFQDSST